jgi:hypothetical protein
LTVRRADRKFLKIALERNYLERAQAERLVEAMQARGLPANELAIEFGYLSPRRVHRLQNHLLYRAMRRADKEYASLAERSGILDHAQLQRALHMQKVRFQQSRARVRLGSLLIELGLLDADQDRDLRLRASQPADAATMDATAEVTAHAPLSDVGVELASELGGIESGLASDQEFLESDQVEADAHLVAANAETRIVDEEASSAKSPAGSTASRGIAIPLEAEDDEEEVVDEVVERTTTRYRAIDEAVTRVEAIRKVQHDLSNSGVFMAKDSAEIFERACRARACDRLTQAPQRSPRSGGAGAGSTAASRAVLETERAEREEREAEELLWELESQAQAAEAGQEASGSKRPTRRWKPAALKAFLGIDDDAA